MFNEIDEILAKILTSSTGAQAKHLGKTKLTIPEFLPILSKKEVEKALFETWDSVSSEIMHDLIYTSFEQNPEALKRLLSTGDAILTHTQDKGKWGTEFPRILMEVRDELRNQIVDKQSSEQSATDLIKDGSGNPITVYRGYAMKEDRFANAIEETVAGTASDYIASGFYFTSDPEEAQMYAESHTDKSEEPPTAENPEGGRINRHYVGDFAKVSAFNLRTGKGVLEFKDLHDFNRNKPDDISGYVIKLNKGTLTTDTSEYFVTDPTQVVFVNANQSQATDTTKEFLDYANQFGFTDEAALLAKDLPKASEEAKKVEEEYVFTFNDGFKINLPFSLNDQQKSALYELEKFIEDYGTEITLSGYAGTGKSTIIGIFSKWLDHRIGRGNIVYTAPTHRANVITKQNNPNANVYTLSALFGFTPDTDIAMEQGSLDLRELEFRSKNQVKYEPGQLIIIDEASMVQDGLYEYIQKIVAKDGVSVIYVGDSAQLRPVKSDHISKVFTSDGVPQITLTKVERTGDNPILKEATRLRQGEGLSYQTDINDKGQGVLYTSDAAVIDENLKQIVSSEEFNADPLHFRVLTATNAAVSAYNSKIRSLRYGKFAKPFVKGDIIMGYSNKLRKPDGSYKLVNSGDYVIQNITDTTVKFKTDKGDIEFKAFKLSIRPTGSTIMDDFQITVIDKNEPDSKLFEIVEYKDRLWRMAKEAKQNKQISKYRDLVQMAFNIDNELNITKNLEDNQGRLKIRKAIDYGYAQTVWKSQGSTYSKVLILSNEIDTFGYGKDVMQLRNELRYVAVSRAKNFVIINSEAENKKKVSMRNEIAEEDLLDDIEFEPATEEQAIKASLQDSIDELTANGKQRRKECE